MFRPTQAIVDLAKLRANYRALKKLAGPGFFCPMVKANAYGHGAIEVTRALAGEGCERVGVALVEEGVQLRQAGIDTEILVFSRLTSESARAVLEFRLTPVLSSWADFESLSKAGAANSFSVHIKINTGMNRMGFPIEDVPRLKQFFRDQKKLKCAGVCTHLSQGSDGDDPHGRTAHQIAEFQKAFEGLGEGSAVSHVLNSDAMLARAKVGKNAEGLGCRPGLALYGLSESSLLEPVMSLTTKIDFVRRIGKGESVSYGGRWTASKPSWVGVLPIGYADGYWRSFSNKGSMLFRGQRVPVVGTVCMDYSLLDLTNACDAREPELGEEVVVFGTQGNASVSVTELTKLVDTIPYELVTGISARVPRVYR